MATKDIIWWPSKVAWDYGPCCCSLSCPGRNVDNSLQFYPQRGWLYLGRWCFYSLICCPQSCHCDAISVKSVFAIIVAVTICKHYVFYEFFQKLWRLQIYKKMVTHGPELYISGCSKLHVCFSVHEGQTEKVKASESVCFFHPAEWWKRV